MILRTPDSIDHAAAEAPLWRALLQTSGFRRLANGRTLALLRWETSTDALERNCRSIASAQPALVLSELFVDELPAFAQADPVFTRALFYTPPMASPGRPASIVPRNASLVIYAGENEGLPSEFRLLVVELRRLNTPGYHFLAAEEAAKISSDTLASARSLRLFLRHPQQALHFLLGAIGAGLPVGVLAPASEMSLRRLAWGATHSGADFSALRLRDAFRELTSPPGKDAPAFNRAGLSRLLSLANPATILTTLEQRLQAAPLLPST